MSYYSKNCMVSKDIAEQIRQREIDKRIRLLKVCKSAAQYFKRYKEIVIKDPSKRDGAD